MTSTGGSVAVIGIGYLGLPFAVEFGKRCRIIGFDIKPDRIAELRAGCDHTREVPPEQLAEARHLTLMVEPADLAAAHEPFRDQGVQALHRYCGVFCNLKRVFARDDIDQRL
jgi:UDP-N-acetyl-D-mannosaminuronate dehydrogenase